MLQEQQRAVVDARRAGTEAPVEALVLVLVFDEILFWFPLHAKGRVGEHVVKLFVRVAVVRHEITGHALGVLDTQGVAVDEVVDGLVLDQQVGAAERVGLGVVFLAEQFDVGIRVLALV